MSEKQILSDTPEVGKPIFLTMKEVVADGFREIERLYKGKRLITRMSTGFRELDELSSGLQPSQLIIIAARPGMGKTAFALDIARHVAMKERASVAIFSLEMPHEQLAMRMISSEGSVDFTKLRNGALSESDWPRMTKAAGMLAETAIFVDSAEGRTLNDIKAQAMELKAEKGLGLLIIDYVQLMKGEEHEILKGLKQLAEELDTTVIALYQLGRRCEMRKNKRPELSDMEESVEQDADMIIFIYRYAVYNMDADNRTKGIAEVIIGKHKSGPVGMVKLSFNSKALRFEDPAEDAEE